METVKASAPPMATPYRMLSEYLADDSLLALPPCVLPHLAWEGRVTLLSAAEKGGKSTLVGQGVAAMVGPDHGFLDGDAALGSVLWLAMDEPVPDLVRRLKRHGARDGVGIFTGRPTPEELDNAITDLRPRLLVIDTLTRMALGSVTEGGSRMQWAPLMADISAIARTQNLAILVLHHFTRNGERYSESAEIGASVDQIVDMKTVEGNGNARLLASRGRVTFEKLTISYNPDDGYGMDTGRPIAMSTLVLQLVNEEPGLSTRQIRERMKGRAVTVDNALAQLTETGAIRQVTKGRSTCWYPATHGPKLV